MFCSQHPSNCQFHFQPGFSTETALPSIVNSWFSSLDHKNAICGVFVDLTKVFDSVPHRPLLDSLPSLDLPPLLLFWLHSFLQGHTQQVIINGSISSKSQVTSGVPKFLFSGLSYSSSILTTLLICPSSLQPPSLFMLMWFFFCKKFLLQLQCPLFNPISILSHHGLPLIISPSTPKKTNTWLSLVSLPLF